MSIEEKIKNLVKDRPEADEFLLLYAEYCALVDDLVDEPYSTDRTRKTILLAAKVFNCNYWRRYGDKLVIIDRLIQNMYFDSVVWEKAEEQWKRQHAKVYSHSAQLMVLSVILIEFGDDVMRQLSLEIKEYAYELHKKDSI